MHKRGLTAGAVLLLWMFMVSTVGAAQSVYVVKAGDSLWKISQTYGVSVEQIKKINGLSSDQLSIGQTLKINNEVNVQAQSAPVSAGSGATSVYTVVKGDNLWNIASRFGTSVEKIKALNGLDSNDLQIGDKLIINGTAPAVQKAATPPSAPAPVSVSRSGDNLSGVRIIESAAQYIGTPYRYGGAAPGGFDCSGFTTYIFGQAGISLPRTAAGQYGSGIAVSKSDLMAGDLVFFSCGGKGIDHVGIYSGSGKFIHSSSPRSGGVIYSSLSEAYYSNSYTGARRIIR
ncbi:Endopeptidase, NLPC/P60 domain [Syntrophomonas zehnderi OL-4]|uniref:Endopeptidase, NLPC/P60 domain n=1 Tax=Syntrophomonas zehnderi OL-4 TaxID=690567 RepID=A0A0E4C906_9FIRM|nr:LysM peptidoglycan-binding domain-containing protein [Syntrophomonas zehnderi]CFX76539.1 Endopeptidase, NLPC/P60 domain [Syntrophomonas zehnderi OL-4]